MVDDYYIMHVWRIHCALAIFYISISDPVLCY